MQSQQIRQDAKKLKEEYQKYTQNQGFEEHD